MQHAAGGEAAPQTLDQLRGDDRLGRARGVGLPFGGLEVVDGHEGRLAAHGQPHVLGLQVGLDPLAKPVEGIPTRVIERLGDAYGVDQPRDVHLELEGGLGQAHPAGDGGRRPVVGRSRQRQVPLAAQEAGGGVEADPSGAGNVDLGPGVQVGEIAPCSERSLEGIDVGLELNQIAGDEASGEAEAAHHLDQEPGAVAARSRSERQGLIGSLNSRLHAYEMGDGPLNPRIQADEKIDGALSRGLQCGDGGLEQRPAVVDMHIGRQVAAQILGIAERQGFGIGLDEKIERIDHRHLGRQVDGDGQFRRPFRKHQPRQPVAVGILLPVDEVVRRRDLQRIAGNPRAAVGRRAAGARRAGQDPPAGRSGTG